MEERRTRRRPRSSSRRRRRWNPGFLLYATCTAIMLICFCIGGAQFIVEQSERRAQEREQAQAQAELEAQQQQEAEEAAAKSAATYDFTVALMGDMNLYDDWSTMRYLSTQVGGASAIFDETLLRQMQEADLFCLNSTFAFTDGGEPLAKQYNFYSKPSNISLYQTMGVDLVALANDHVCDMGEEGLTDTLNTLENASIAAMGAGTNLEEASAPYYWEIQGQTVAFVNASQAVTDAYAPSASGDSYGVFSCRPSSAQLLQTITQAKSQADYVIVYLHWGENYVAQASAAQQALAHEVVDAGADLVVGAYSHCLQSIEYYRDVPIFYGLGVGWFNDRTLNTCLLQLHFTGDGHGGSFTTTLTPAIQSGCTTRSAQTEAEAQAVYDEILAVSTGVSISSGGIVTPEGQEPEEPASTGGAEDGGAGTAEDPSADQSGDVQGETPSNETDSVSSQDSQSSGETGSASSQDSQSSGGTGSASSQDSQSSGGTGSASGQDSQSSGGTGSSQTSQPSDEAGEAAGQTGSSGSDTTSDQDATDPAGDLDSQFSDQMDAEDDLGETGLA